MAATPTPAASLDPAATLARYAVPGEPPAGALDLMADDGTPFDLAALRGRPVLVYFGYTSCPDVCPATTGVLAEVVRASVDQPRVVFVTVDPERDTADVSAAWGATSAPRIFVVDASGIVRAKLSGIVGTDEVRAAIRSVAGWVPSY